MMAAVASAETTPRFRHDAGRFGRSTVEPRTVFGSGLAGRFADRIAQASLHSRRHLIGVDERRNRLHLALSLTNARTTFVAGVSVRAMRFARFAVYDGLHFRV